MYAIYLKCPSGRFHPISLPDGVQLTAYYLQVCGQNASKHKKHCRR